MNKAYAKIVTALFLNVTFSSCQSVKQYANKNNFNNANEAIAVNLKPIWVHDALVSKNDFYRKVNLFTPILYKNSVLVANAIDGLASYDKNSKFLNWKVILKYGIEASGTVVNDALFVGGLDGIMYSINAESGQINWKFDTKAEITSQPLVYNGIVYFLNGASSLFSLEAQTGRQVWVYSRQETTAKMTIRGGSRPTFKNGIIYSGFSDGSIVAINATTGTPQWEVSLNKNGRFKDIDATPVLDEENIFINSYDDKLYCLSQDNGSIIWKYPTGGATAPLITGNKLILSTSTGSVVSLNKKTGDVNWKKTNIMGMSTEPLLVGGSVIYGESQGSLKAIDLLTGADQAAFDPGKGVMSKPSADGNSLYFISGEANVYQVDLVPQTKGMIPYLVN
ncbi:MAG: PQQ-binding-like beta-propeller repeat protein [Moraxellaceae bacterium]|nr:PQQ-binding-like beta-propeller repeat protein [Pseudobdellovibrionaceae bacterium]